MCIKNLTGPRFAIGCPILLLCAVLGTAVFIEWSCAERPHPTDQQLIQRFKDHRPEFQRLLEMFQADRGLGRVADGFTRPEDPSTVGITKARIAEYRRLFREIGLESGVEGYDSKDRIWFHASSHGLSISGSGKGYAYLKKRPDEMVANLEIYSPPHPNSYTAFRHIEGNWYLYYDYED